MIRSYDEQEFDMSEESENFFYRCGLFQVKAWLSRPKNMAASDPMEVT